MVDVFMTWLQDFRYSRHMLSWTPMDATMGFPFPIRMQGQPYFIVPFYRTPEAGEGQLFHSAMMVVYPTMKVVGYLSMEVLGKKTYRVMPERVLDVQCIDAYYQQLVKWVSSEGDGLGTLQNQLLSFSDEGRVALYTALRSTFFKDHEEDF